MACSCLPLGVCTPYTAVHADSPDEWLSVIASHMNHQSDMPLAMRGVFWMDGNAPEHLVTLEGSDYDMMSLRAILRTYAPNVWATSTPVKTLLAHKATCCIYDIHHNEAANWAYIDLWLNVCCRAPHCCLYFTMTQDEHDAHLWYRDSIICRSCPVRCSARYLLKRVATRQGGSGSWQATPHLQEMADFLRGQGTLYMFGGSKAKGASAKISPEEMAR